MEVRAALALARRRVLSEAYLDLAVSRAVTDEAVRTAYEAERAAAGVHDRVAVRHVLTATEAEASEVLRRARRGERFGRLAGRLSLDDDTKDAGGSYGLVHPDALPSGLAAIAEAAPVGTLIGPFRTEAGWHVARVDARRRIARPSLEARMPAIREALRAEALEEAAANAMIATSVRIEETPTGAGRSRTGEPVVAEKAPSAWPQESGRARDGGAP